MGNNIGAVRLIRPKEHGIICVFAFYLFFFFFTSVFMNGELCNKSAIKDFSYFFFPP